MSKAADAFRTISEVADVLDVPKHVLRFWEVKFPQIKPMKRGGGRRFYRPEDMDLLRAIHRLLHVEGYTIKGVQRKLRSEGVERVKAGLTGAGKAAGDGQASAASAKHAAPARPTRKLSTRGRRAQPADRQAVLRAAITELEAVRDLLVQRVDEPERSSGARAVSNA